MLGAGARATRTRIAVCLALGAAPSVAPRTAVAREPDGSELSRAHDAYARGGSAYARGDYARAAREFAVADSLVPDAVTLRVALDAATLADDAVLGTELILRSERGPVDAPLAHAVSVARVRFAHRTGTIVIRCDTCLGVVDGTAAEPGSPRVVAVGVHVVVLQRNGAPQEQMLTVGADEIKEVMPTNDPAPATASLLVPPAPRPLPVVDRARPAGISPGWLALGGAVTAGLIAATIASWVDTASDHSDFAGEGCNRVATAPCTTLSMTGQSAQERTLWLGAGAGVAALGTVALGLFAVRWHRARQPAVSLGVSGASASLRFTF